MFTFANEAQVLQRFWADSSSYVPTLLNVCRSEALGAQDYPHWLFSTDRICQRALTVYAFVSHVSSPVADKNCSHCEPLSAKTLTRQRYSINYPHGAFHKRHCTLKRVHTNAVAQLKWYQRQSCVKTEGMRVCVRVFRFACVWVILLLKVSSVEIAGTSCNLVTWFFF